jgi:sec-independent protein translocase protein TatB
MFDIGWPELMIVMIVALLVIGPKDLPKALRQLGKWVGAARRMSTEFQRHVDDIVRETELDDVKRGIDSVRSVNIKRELEKQIDPDGSLSRAFDVNSTKEKGRNSSGKEKPALADGSTPVKSWQSADHEGAPLPTDGRSDAGPVLTQTKQSRNPAPGNGATKESGMDTGRSAESRNFSQSQPQSASARPRGPEPAETSVSSTAAATKTVPSDQG